MQDRTPVKTWSLRKAAWPNPVQRINLRQRWVGSEGLLIPTDNLAVAPKQSWQKKAKSNFIFYIQIATTMEKQKRHTVYFSIPTDFISAMAWPFNCSKCSSHLGTSCVRGIPDLPFLSEWNHDLLGPGGVTSLSFPTWLAGTVIASEILEFSKKKNFKKQLLSECLFFQANCHCHRMANLSSQIKLNTQLETVCLSLNQFFAAKALHAGWRLCNGVHTMRPWYHGRLTLKDCHGIEGISVSLQLLDHSTPNWTTLQPLESSKMDQWMIFQVQNRFFKRCSPWLHLPKALTQGIRLPFHPCPGRILIGVDWTTSTTHKTTSRTKWVSLKLGSGWVF